MAISEHWSRGLLHTRPSMGGRNRNHDRGRCGIGHGASFDLGLLRPRFVKWAGGIVGMPFSLEGYFSPKQSFSEFTCTDGIAFRRVPSRGRTACCPRGMASAAFVVKLNSWMNNPTIVTEVPGK